MKQKRIDSTMLRFIMVGVINTLVGSAIMFGLYNLAHCSYWVSSLCNYILTSILSFFLNKFFTFRNKTKDAGQIVRFAVNIVLCYVLAYGIAKPLCYWLLRETAQTVQDNVSLLAGMGLFTVLNYVGQRFFAFAQSSDCEK